MNEKTRYIEPTEEELKLWAAFQALDERILEVDNIPRCSLDLEAKAKGWSMCLCAKMWSEAQQQAAWVETWYSAELLVDAEKIDLAGLLFDGPIGIKTAFERFEATEMEGT